MSFDVVSSRFWRQPSGRDLKWVLVRRILLVAVLCILGGVVLVLRDVGQQATVQNEDSVAAVAKQLSLQLTRIDAALDRQDRFPDWDVIANHVLHPGQCIQYVGKATGAPHSICQGMDSRGQVSPDWFVHAYKLFPDQSLIAEQPLVHNGVALGTVVSTIEARTIADRAWLELSRLVRIGLAMIVAMCLLVYVAIERSLRPTADILAGLSRLADGGLGHRLPRFKMRELDRIADVFNGLAERLEVTTHERSELALKLVNAQEQERQHMARELHDDVAQRLSVVNSLATSIKRACQTLSPAVSRQSEELVSITSGTMRALRETLTQLRPPEIDDLGLIASLRALIDAHNRQAGGKTSYTLQVGNGLDELHSDMAAQVYRIVQEGLNNAAKHANAQNVAVVLTDVIEGVPKGRRINLAIVDDGMAAFVSQDDNKGGLGLAGIRERVFALSGSFYAGRHDPKGFELRVSFPVREGAEEAA